MIRAIRWFATLVLVAGPLLVVAQFTMRVFTDDPQPGEYYQFRSDDYVEKNPFREEEPFIVHVIELRDGWVQYRGPSGGLHEAKVREFKAIYRLR